MDMVRWYAAIATKVITHILIQAGGNVHLILFRHKVRMTSGVTANDEASQHLVKYWIDGILHDTEDIESRQNWLG